MAQPSFPWLGTASLDFCAKLQMQESKIGALRCPKRAFLLDALVTSQDVIRGIANDR